MIKFICHCSRLIRTFPFSEGEDLKPGRPGLYEQTSFNCVDFRLRSAEHSSELDALPSLARKFAPCGVARDYLRNRKLTLLTLGCARQSIQASLMLCSRWHESCECLSAEGAAFFSTEFFVHRLAQIITDFFNI